MSVKYFEEICKLYKTKIQKPVERREVVEEAKKIKSTAQSSFLHTTTTASTTKSFNDAGPEAAEGFDPKISVDPATDDINSISKPGNKKKTPSLKKESLYIEPDDSNPDKVLSDGTKMWLKDGEPNREDGPAIICPDGTVGWFKNGMLHNENGPAIIGADGTKEWWSCNIRRTEGQHFKFLKK